MIFDLVREYSTTECLFGEGSQLKFNLRGKNILLIASSSVEESSLSEFVDHYERGCNCFVTVIRTSGEPSSRQINETFKSFDCEFDVVVGWGGGSSIDFAKALSILVGSGGNIEDYEFGGKLIRDCLPVYAIPTTCGSGSEVTKYCVVNNTETKRKFTLGHPDVTPTQSAIAPNFLDRLPPYVMLDSGLDAFIHCLEAALNRSTGANVFELCTVGISLARKVLPRVSSSEVAVEDLPDLSNLSLIGGLAIDRSRTGLIHTLSVAFAEFVDIPHGRLNAILLPFATKFNLQGYDGRLVELINAGFEENLVSDEEAFRFLVDWLSSLGGLDVPLDGACVEHISHRILQDSGLAGVSYGRVTKMSIVNLVEEIVGA